MLAWRRSRSQVGTQVFVSKARSGRSYLSQSEAELSPSTGNTASIDVSYLETDGNGILSDICRVGQRLRCCTVIDSLFRGIDNSPDVKYSIIL